MSITVRFPASDYPEVRVAPEAWDDMFYITHKLSTEVGWLGTVERLSEYRFLVTEVFLPRQEVSGTTAEMQPDHIAEFAGELLDERGVEVYSKLRAWCHSHANMGLGSSKQDDDMLAQLVADAGETFVAIRTNKKGDAIADIRFPSGLTLEGVSVVKDIPKPDLSSKWDALLKERVQPLAKTTAHYYGSQSRMAGYLGGNQAGGQHGQFAYPYKGADLPPAPPATPPAAQPKGGGKGKGDAAGGGGAPTPEDIAWFAEQDRIAHEMDLLPFSALATQEQRDRWSKLTNELLECEAIREDEEEAEFYGAFDSDYDAAEINENYLNAVAGLVGEHPDLWRTAQEKEVSK